MKKLILFLLTSQAAFANPTDWVAGGGDNPQATAQNQCIVSNASLQWEAGSCSAGAGDVNGPASSTDNAAVRFDGATGKILQNSGVIIDDSNNITGVASLTATTFLGKISIGTSQAAIGNGLTNTAGTDNIMFYTGSALRGSVGPAGAWTIGTASGTENHAVNGNVAVTGTITSGAVAVPTISSTSTLTNKSIDGDDNTVTDLANASIKAAAGIAVNKLAALTASRAVVSDGSGFLAASAVTSTQLANMVTDDFCVQGRTGDTEVVYFKKNVKRPFTINTVTHGTSGGSITAAIQDDGVALTGCTALTVDSSETETDCTDGAIAVGQDASVSFSSDSSATDWYVCLHVTYD